MYKYAFVLFIFIYLAEHPDSKEEWLVFQKNEDLMQEGDLFSLETKKTKASRSHKSNMKPQSVWLPLSLAELLENSYTW